MKDSSKKLQNYNNLAPSSIKLQYSANDNRNRDQQSQILENEE